jgi:hypothetical protein
MFSFLSRLFHRQFTHDQKDFRLLITPSPSEKGQITFKYSANGGGSWKYIYHAKETPQGLKWQFFSIKSTSYSYSVRIGKNFCSYQKILDFERLEKSKYESWTKSKKRFLSLK